MEIEDRLCSNLATITLCDPVAMVYNPMNYAAETHQCYVDQYGNSTKQILLLGMNPDPYGMAQNGVWHADDLRAQNIGLSQTISYPFQYMP